MKHYTVHSTTQDDTNIDLWWIKKVCVLHNLCEMFVDVRVYHFPVQTQISCKICISSFETSLALAGSCCGLDSTVRAGWLLVCLFSFKEFTIPLLLELAEGEKCGCGLGGSGAEKFSKMIQLWTVESRIVLRNVDACLWVQLYHPCNSLRRYSETMEWGCSPLS